MLLITILTRVGDEAPVVTAENISQEHILPKERSGEVKSTGFRWVCAQLGKQKSGESLSTLYIEINGSRHRVMKKLQYAVCEIAQSEYAALNIPAEAIGALFSPREDGGSFIYAIRKDDRIFIYGSSVDAASEKETVPEYRLLKKIRL